MQLESRSIDTGLIYAESIYDELIDIGSTLTKRRASCVVSRTAKRRCAVMVGFPVDYSGPARAGSAARDSDATRSSAIGARPRRVTPTRARSVKPEHLDA